MTFLLSLFITVTEWVPILLVHTENNESNCKIDSNLGLVLPQISNSFDGC